MKLHTKIVLGLATGALAGITVNALAGGAAWVTWVNANIANPIGQVFLRLLFMTVVPLVFASLTLGVAGIGNVSRLGRIAAKTLVYFLISTALSTVLGLVLVSIMDPGSGIAPTTRQELLATYRGQAADMQLGTGVTFGVSTFVNMIPRNPVQAAASGDMLAVICFALIFGAALTRLSTERARPMLGVVEALADVVMVIIDFAMKLAPLGVFALIFTVTSRFGWHLLGELGWYVVVVVLGLLLHAAVSLSVLVRFLGGMNPIQFWLKSRMSLITAFSTSSSNATLPTTMAVAEHQLGVPPTIAGFVLPLGATMNMNGTALYEGVTVLFLAQVFGIDLTLGQQSVVLILSVLTAVGTAGVPGGSLPLMMVVLAAVGVPPEGIAIILGVDRILDMCRTTLNVAGDLTAALFVARTEPVAPDIAIPEAPVAVA